MRSSVFNIGYSLSVVVLPSIGALRMQCLQPVRLPPVGRKQPANNNRHLSSHTATNGYLMECS